MTLPVRARLFLWVVAAAACAVLLQPILQYAAGQAPRRDAAGAEDLLVLGQFAILIVAARSFPLSAGPHRTIDFGLAVVFALAIFAGHPFAALVAGASQLVAQASLMAVGWRRAAVGRRGLYSVLFNTSQTVVSVTVASAVLELPLPPPWSGLRTPAAGALLYLTNSILVATIAAFQKGQPIWPTWLANRWWSAGQASGLLVLGYLTARAAGDNPGVPLLMTVPAALTYASLRRTAAAEASLQLRDEFLRVAAHELRTPLTSLRGYSQLLRRQVQRDQRFTGEDRLQRAVGVIDGQTDRLCALVDQLLDVSRLQTGKLTLDRQHVDLTEVARHLAAALQPITPGYRLVVDAPEPVRCTVDRIRIEQALTNLINNAARHAGGGERIEIVVARDARGARLMVRDYGVGIPREARERIFDRYVQVSQMPASGLGLGLFITQQIVVAHGGTIRVDCPPGGGTCFTIVIPTRPTPDVPSRTRSLASEPSPA